MIKAKLKICSECGEEKQLWKSIPKLCKSCFMKLNGKPLPKAKKKIAFASDKLLEERARYRILRDEYMDNHKICEAKVVCNGSPSVDLHHIRPREFFLCDVAVFMAVCRNCHNWIPENDSEARKRGLLKSKHVISSDRQMKRE